MVLQELAQSALLAICVHLPQTSQLDVMKATNRQLQGIMSALLALTTNGIIQQQLFARRSQQIPSQYILFLQFRNVVMIHSQALQRLVLMIMSTACHPKVLIMIKPVILTQLVQMAFIV